MDRRALWISAAATLLGIALLRLYIERFEREATGGSPTRVLVLTRDVAQGSTLERDLLSERALPQAYLESRHIAARDLEQVLGAKLAVTGRVGEALLWTDLSSLREHARQLSSLVPEGMRAITLEPRQGGFDGLLVPGDRVDVLLVNRHAQTEAVPRTRSAIPEGVSAGGVALTNDRDPIANRVAQNLLVLAVGEDLGGPHARRNASARSVSLSVTLEQAALLAEADRGGDLRLVLRNPDDLEVTAARAAAQAVAPVRPAQRGDAE
jgi:pilus assembly protein CpaB